MLESGLQPRTCDCQVQCLSNQEALQQPRHDAFKPSYLIYQGQGRWWPQRCEAWRGILKQISWRQNMLKRSRSVTLCDPMDRSLSGFYVHGISQARVLEWVAISFSRGSSWPRDRTLKFFLVSCIIFASGKNTHGGCTSDHSFSGIILNSFNETWLWKLQHPSATYQGWAGRSLSAW